MVDEDTYKHILEWNTFVRRHNANIFDVIFKDVDYTLQNQDLIDIITDISQFFELTPPDINNHCNTLAKIQYTSEKDVTCELYYNWELLHKNGINNRDAFILCMVHELAHLYIKDRRFLLCRNELWCHELAADYVVGIYSALKQIATGKYKYVIGKLPATLTHPKGEHRVAAVEFARECAYKYSWHNISSSLMGLPAFVYGRQRLLNEDFCKIL